LCSNTLFSQVIMRALALLCFVNQVKVDIIVEATAHQDIVEGGLDLALELPGNILTYTSYHH